MDDIFKIKLTSQEIIYFGAALQLPGLNIEDDWQVPDEAEFEKIIHTAGKSLEAKHYISLPAGDDEVLTLDQTVAAMVSTLGMPQYGLIVHTFRERQVEPERVRYFGVGELIVEQSRDGDDLYTLTACRTRDVALQRLLVFVGLTNQPPAHTQSFRIAAADMAQVPYIIAGNGPEDGAAFLREAGTPAKAAARLAAALENPIRQSVIRAVVWIDGEPQEAGRLTLLEEVYGLWLIVPVGGSDEELLIAPVTHLEAADAIRELALRVMPLEQD